MASTNAGVANDYGALAKLYEYIQGAVTTQVLVAAVKLNVADHLLAGAQSADQLARKAECDPANLDRILNVLASLNLVERHTSGEFALLPLGRRLCAGKDGSLRDFCLLWGQPWFWDGLGRLAECVKSGRSASEILYGMGMFERFDRDRDAETSYNRALDSLNEPLFIDALVRAYDYSTFPVIVDVGGGQGATLAALLKANLNARGVVVDRERLRGPATALMLREGLKDRCAFVAADFRAYVPPGGDLYLLKWILVDWNDREAANILSCCRCAMNSQARLLVVAGAGEDHSFLNRLTDASLIAFPGGRTRTKGEITKLAAQAGLTHVATTPVAHQWLFEFRC